MSFRMDNAKLSPFECLPAEISWVQSDIAKWWFCRHINFDPTWWKDNLFCLNSLHMPGLITFHGTAVGRLLCIDLTNLLVETKYAVLLRPRISVFLHGHHWQYTESFKYLCTMIPISTNSNHSPCLFALSMKWSWEDRALIGFPRAKRLQD